MFENDKYSQLGEVDYAKLCIACQKSNYTPSNWKTKIVPIIEKANMDRLCDYMQIRDQIDIALAFHAVGVYHPRYIDELAYLITTQKSKEFIENAQEELSEVFDHHSRQEMVRKKNACVIEDIAQMNEDNENMRAITNALKGNSTITNQYVSWLKKDLENFIGANTVLNNVTVSNELIVPLLMKINIKTGNFANLTNSSVKENLKCNKNELM